MELTPDNTIVFTIYGLPLNATILFTWIVMALLTVASILITRNLRPDVPPDRWRTVLEEIVLTIQGQIDEISARPDRRLLYFSGTLFLFIVTSNLLMVVPGWHSPTASLSTTVALAVLIAVLIFGVASRGGAAICMAISNPTSSCCPSTSSAKRRAGCLLRSGSMAMS